MKLHLADMNWPEVEELLGLAHAVIVPVGSTEQHGRHLPLSVDSACATYLAEQAAEKVSAEKKIKVVVAPAVCYTEVSAFAEFPGSIGISQDTEIRLIADIARSFVKQGFRNIVFLNGHYENIGPITTALHRISLEYPEAGLFALDWVALGAETIIKSRKSQMGLHADELETSLTLIIQPENVQMEEARKEMPEFSLSEKWGKPDFYGPRRLLFQSRGKLPRMGSGYGVMGDPTVASRETGEIIAGAVVKDLAELIVEIVRSEGGEAK